MIQTITGDDAHIQSFRDKKATFMLALSNTATADIPGITQAGIPADNNTPIYTYEYCLNLRHL
jgi:NaMN:DMB phosphoribosyltransferase